jgi:hypothetical protein
VCRSAVAGMFVKPMYGVCFGLEMAAIPCCVCMQALHDVLHGCDVAEQDVFVPLDHGSCDCASF